MTTAMTLSEHLWISVSSSPVLTQGISLIRVYVILLGVFAFIPKLLNYTSQPVCSSEEVDISSHGSPFHSLLFCQKPRSTSSLDSRQPTDATGASGGY